MWEKNKAGGGGEQTFLVAFKIHTDSVPYELIKLWHEEKKRKKELNYERRDAFNLKLRLILPVSIWDTILFKIGLHAAVTCNAY